MTISGIDLVVVNYRTPGDLREFVQSVTEQPPRVPWSLIIVNVDPEEADTALAKEASDFESIFYLDIGWNCGYARACNAAVARSGREVIGLFNADVVLSPGAVDECVDAILSNHDWGVLGPRQVNERNQITHAGIFGSLEKPEHRSWLGPDVGYADVREAVTVSGSAMFTRRELWDRLHHCPSFKRLCPDAEGAMLLTSHYYEDTWLAYHAQAHHQKAVYYGPVKIVHKWHRASPQGGWAELQWEESRRLFRFACDNHEPPIPHD